LLRALKHELMPTLSATIPEGTMTMGIFEVAHRDGVFVIVNSRSGEAEAGLDYANEACANEACAHLNDATDAYINKEVAV